MQNGEYVYAYCVSCDAGAEAQLCRDIQSRLPYAVALFPRLDRKELHQGEWIVCVRSLLPGYVFVYTPSPVAVSTFYRCERLNRVLCYEQGNTEDIGILKGADYDFAAWVYENDGHIGISEAIQVGDKVEVVSGPLVAYQGNIVRINRKKHCALVKFYFGDVVREIWLAFDLLGGGLPKSRN